DGADALRDLQREDRRQGPGLPADHQAADRRRPVQGGRGVSRRPEPARAIRHDFAQQHDNVEDPMKVPLIGVAVTSLAIVAAVGAQSPREEELARSQYQSGLDFLQNKRYAEAIKDFQTVIDSFPKSAVADSALMQIGFYQLDIAHNVEAAQAANEK